MEYIQQVYVINLDERSDRYKKIQLEFERVGITNYVRFPAVKPDLADYDVKHNFASKDQNYIRGSIGCKMSHLAVLKHARRRGFNKILIFEDDVEFTGDLTSLKSTLQALKDDFTLLYLSANLYRANIKPVRKGYAKISNALCAHSYVVNCRDLDYLLSGIERSPHEVDVFYKQVQLDKKCFILTPGITKQRSDYSNIMERKVVYETIG